MPITPDQFVSYYPRLYHMAEADSWDSIRKHGLLSTTALLDLFEIARERRRVIVAEHRPQSICIQHPKHGAAIIRDQKPMRESALRKCLNGMTPRQWYEMLNNRVFFWVTAERVQTLLNARAYRNKRHTVITIDTASLVACYADKIRLSPINSGSTLYKPQERGISTFRPFDQYPFEQRRKMRGINNAIAEACVLDAVPDLRDFALTAEERQGGRTLHVLYRRKRI